MLTAFAAEHDRPNILFAIADDASYPHMSAYGVDWVETPSFDRVAKKDYYSTTLIRLTPNVLRHVPASSPDAIHGN